MAFVLKLKHWQVFAIIFAGLLMSNFQIENQKEVSIIISIIGTLLCFIWPLLIGHGLYQLLPERIYFNYNFFIINSFIWLAAYVAIMAISGGQGMTFHGLAALPGFYFFYAFVYYVAFPVRVLKSIENGRKATLQEYIGDFFLVIFLPFGIWFLQPRINKVAQREII